MRLLGIETSCDETAASVVENGTKILSNIVASSSEIHKITGGIIPEQAARQQITSVIPVISQSLIDADINSGKIDAIAVTIGPGLIGSLLVGIETAKTLSSLWNKPIVPVNHLVAHIYANWLSDKSLPNFPLLALVVSGGHTDLVLMKNHNQLKWIGGTRDDAAGEAFDKTARLLGLPYPGGPEISKNAERYLLKQNSKLDLFPRPMINTNDFDWSFSGLKTSVMNYVSSKKGDVQIDQLSAEVQEAIVDVLVHKSIAAIKKYQPKSFLIAGGVAANKRLRNKLSERIHRNTPKVKFFSPKPSLCTDNAAYIASCAYFNYRPLNYKKINANPQLAIVGES